MEDDKDRAGPSHPSSFLLRVSSLIHPLAEIGHYTSFLLRSLLALPLALRQPRELCLQFYQILLGALPLGIVAGGALGVVVWMELRNALRDVAGPGALQYLPQGLALAVISEFAPLSAGLLVAGRSGASLGAELGSMRLTEQIDALEVLGISPLLKLVVPRVAACMLALPLLTIFIAYLAVGSGYLAEAIGGSMTQTQFFNECLRVLTLPRVIPAVLKTVVFGYIVGVTGCYFGMTAQGGTEGVGRAATRGVVFSTLLVFASNVLLVRLTQLIV
jgi:phospholipid/cholesterol/gamma-HCH transport system permease protein